MHFGGITPLAMQPFFAAMGAGVGLLHARACTTEYFWVWIKGGNRPRWHAQELAEAFMERFPEDPIVFATEDWRGDRD